MIRQPRCKICRRAGVKLFLKGAKCISPKCPLNRKPYAPGFRGKRRKRFASEYGQQLKEKQKLRHSYYLKEAQFKKYVKQVLAKKRQIGNAQDSLVKLLENRLDNVVFRLGFARSRIEARQLVSHRHFLVNSKKVNIASYQVKQGDKISACPSFIKTRIFQDIKMRLKQYQPPTWLKLNANTFEGQVIGEPSIEEVSPSAEISTIFEFYSR